MIATRTTPLSALFARIKAEMVSLGVWYSTPSEEAAFRTWLSAAWLDSGCTQNFAVLTQPSSQLSIEFGVRVDTSGHRVNVYWSDGSTNSYAPETGVNTSISHTYSTSALHPVVVLGRITRFESSNSDGKTAFGGRVAGLTSLTYLSVLGSNTLSGSVAGLTSLTFLYIIGSNTLSGSVAGLTSLTFLYIQGSNTLSGSVAGLTSLTVLKVQGSNTISGWGAVAAAATGLCLYVHGGLTVLDGAEVNAVLAGFWANRNAAKSRSDRIIDIGKDTPTPNAAPTGQGLTDKAALQAYRSPTPPGTAALWTVTTN